MSCLSSQIHTIPPIAVLKSYHSCNSCRERKIKCSGSHPCTYCSKRRRPCLFPETTKRKLYSVEYVEELEQQTAAMRRQSPRAGSQDALDPDQPQLGDSMSRPPAIEMGQVSEALPQANMSFATAQANEQGTFALPSPRDEDQLAEPDGDESSMYASCPSSPHTRLICVRSPRRPVNLLIQLAFHPPSQITTAKVTEYEPATGCVSTRRKQYPRRRLRNHCFSTASRSDDLGMAIIRGSARSIGYGARVCRQTPTSIRPQAVF